MMHKNLFLRLLVWVLAVPVAVLANASRVALNNGILSSYNPAWSEGFWHELSGWFLLVLSCLFGLAREKIVTNK